MIASLSLLIRPIYATIVRCGDVVKHNPNPNQKQLKKSAISQMQKRGSKAKAGHI